jgi:DNA-binding NarL/FixJ family response regulator
MSGPITVVLADEHALVREALAQWLRTTPDIRVVAHAANGDEAAAAVTHHKPAVVVLGVDMPGRDCFSVARTVRSVSPGTKVIFLSALAQDCHIEQALAVRAAGFLTKGNSPAALAAAIRGVNVGQVHFSPEVQARIVIDSRGTRLVGAPTRCAKLSARELEVLRHITRGLTRKQIAQAMCLSADTVHGHTANLMKKLKLHSRVALTRFAIREGLVTI